MNKKASRLLFVIGLLLLVGCEKPIPKPSPTEVVQRVYLHLAKQELTPDVLCTIYLGQHMADAATTVEWTNSHSKVYLDACKEGYAAGLHEGSIVNEHDFMKHLLLVPDDYDAIRKQWATPPHSWRDPPPQNLK